MEKYLEVSSRQVAVGSEAVGSEVVYRKGQLVFANFWHPPNDNWQYTASVRL